MARTFTMICTREYRGTVASAATGEVFDVTPVMAAALLRTGHFRFHTRVVEPEPELPRRRRTYRRRDLVAEP